MYTVIDDRPALPFRRAVQPRPIRYDPLVAAFAEANKGGLRADTTGLAHWHVLVLRPTQEDVAIAHLAARGFGTYDPMIRQTEVSRGRKREVSRRFFPGYLFCFAWGIDRHRYSLRLIPGIHDLLMAGDNPAIVSDALIDVIQAKEAGVSEYVSRRPRRRRVAGEGAVQGGYLTISTKSHFHDAEALDGAARISLLRCALGLV